MPLKTLGDDEIMSIQAGFHIVMVSTLDSEYTGCPIGENA